jgi:putative membrane protein
MIKRLPVALAALMILGGGTVASAKSASAGHRSGTATNAQDAQFAKMAAMGGTAEISLSKLALMRTHDPAIKKFAMIMVHDHMALGHGLVVTARPLGLATPMMIDPEHQAIRARLSHLSGKAFDSAYMSVMIVDHAKTASLFQKEIAYGKNLHMTNLATKNVNTVQNHLQMAQNITGTQGKPSKIKNPPAM